MNEPRTESSLHHYVAILRRRKWMILQAFVLVPIVALLLSLRQERLYEASADVLLSHQNLAVLLNETQDPTQVQSPDRIAETQARLARVRTVAERTLRAVGLPAADAEEFLADSSVSSQLNSDLLGFRVANPEPAKARRLANEYARQFTVYRRQLDTSSLERARQGVERRLSTLERQGERGSALYDELAAKEQQLRTLQALQTSNVTVVQSAGRARQVQPRPVRNALLGVALGLGLGALLAFLAEALDTRVRAGDEVERRLGLPLLARVPEPPRRLRGKQQLVMMEEPDSPEAEPFRILRTNVEFRNLETGAHSIMITSAVQAEGKSTTIANLAVALARVGQKVILVDLDLRRPFLDQFFSLGGRPGLTHVALGRVELDEALVPIPLRSSERTGDSGGLDFTERSVGSLEVLPAGPLPPDVGEFMTGRRLLGLLLALKERCDLLLIDTPPLLQVSDGVALAAKVDAMIVVTNLTSVRRPLLNELSRVLETCPARKLGYVLTGANLGDAYGYGYGGYAYEPRKGAKLARKAQPPSPRGLEPENV